MPFYTLHGTGRGDSALAGRPAGRRTRAPKFDVHVSLFVARSLTLVPAIRRRQFPRPAPVCMVATIRLPEVRLAATSTAAAGDGRVWLGPAAVRDLGVRLGDPVVVDVRVGGGGSGEPPASDAET